MLLKDFFSQQAAKLGLQDNAELSSLLAKVGTTEMPDELANQFNTGLMSLDGAKNNAALLNYFKPTILNAVDDQFKIYAEKYGISDTMAAEKSTYKKAAILEAELARRLSEAQTNAGDKESKAEISKLNKQLADLQTQLATITDADNAKIAELQKAHEAEQLRMLVDFELGSKNYANRNIDKRVSVLTAHTLLDEALKANKAVIVNENGSLRLKQAENPTMDFVDSGYKPVSVRDFTDKLLADAHLLEVSAPSNAQRQVLPPLASDTRLSGAFQDAMAAAQIPITNE